MRMCVRVCVYTRDVEANVIDIVILVNKFKLQSHHDVHFVSKILGKGMDSL